MARIINSPGVSIVEKDISLRVNQPAGTTVYVTGFADQGPTDEIIAPTSITEFESIYGQPTNAAERYFHHTVRGVFNSSANLLVNRLPWGADAGEGFGSKIGVLAYPVVALSANADYTTASAVTDYNATGNVSYVLGEPTQYNINKSQYLSILNGETFSWASSATDATFGGLETLGKAGLLVFNKSQTSIDNKYQGFYVGLADNTNINPASAFDAIKHIKSVTSAPGISGFKTYTDVPRSRLAFALTASPAFGNNPANNSVSQILEEKITSYDTSGHGFDDTLNIAVFKLRQSVFLSNATTLDYVLEEGYNAAIGYSRQIFSENGGSPQNFFIETVVNNTSPNLQVMVNPYISKALSRVVLNPDGTPTNKIRVYSDQLVEGLANGNILASEAGFTSSAATVAGAYLVGKADSLFAVGSYSESYASDVETKKIGNLPAKLDRSLERIKNDDVYDIDLIVEGGLGTIWVGTSNDFYFDDQTPASVSALRTSSTVLSNTAARDNYMTVYNKFALLAGPPSDGGRGDMLFIADPIRQIVVTGPNNKVLQDPTKNFTVDVYWALRHQFELCNTSYATVPCNWVKVYDNFSTQNVWVPASGFTAALMASADAEIGPWSAAAGYDRGALRGIVDIAFSPNQRQRDDLYKINLNAITQFQGQGIALFGQKTLSRLPSAFDRVNVRRLFLYLEKATNKTVKYFVFEPNSVFTRSRVVNTLSPIFERVKASDGIYDYIIICDERNNTPDIIDNNDMVVDIYIKPTRTAEFITVNFIATRTDANFEELIG